jgi:hypothetical protein
MCTVVASTAGFSEMPEFQSTFTVLVFHTRENKDKYHVHYLFLGIDSIFNKVNINNNVHITVGYYPSETQSIVI